VRLLPWEIDQDSQYERQSDRYNLSEHRFVDVIVKATVQTDPTNLVDFSTPAHFLGKIIEGTI
jgi:hypothetical protein